MDDNLPIFTNSNYATSSFPVGAKGLASGTTTIGNASLELNAYKQAFLHQHQPSVIVSKLRIVRVFLVDADDRVPVAKRVLYRSDEMTTDATDQELYFDIPVNDLLKKHNAERAEIEWEEKTTEGTKTRKGLKEARIRDLVMSVTTIAQF